jgi:uncharacterized membrane protein YozB (DUF420 family)
MDGEGFLGTAADFGADLTLVAYILILLPLMLIGYLFARRKKFVPHHKFTMTAITTLNWVLIVVVMWVTYREGVAPTANDLIGDGLVPLATVHLITGGIAQLLATYLVARMWLENVLPAALKVKNIKFYMRLTLTLWVLTALIGIGMYFAWYVEPASAAEEDSLTPQATEEATAAEAQSAQDETPEGTAEATTSAPQVTEEASAEATPDAVDPYGVSASAEDTPDTTPVSDPYGYGSTSAEETPDAPASTEEATPAAVDPYGLSASAEDTPEAPLATEDADPEAPMATEDPSISEVLYEDGAVAELVLPLDWVGDLNEDGDLIIANSYAAWEAYVEADDDLPALRPGRVIGRLLTPADLGATLDDAEDPRAVIEAYVEAWDEAGIEFDREDQEELVDNGRAVAFQFGAITREDDGRTLDVSLIAFALDDDQGYALLVFYTAEGQITRFAGSIEGVVGTIRYTPGDSLLEPAATEVD